MFRLHIFWNPVLTQLLSGERRDGVSCLQEECLHTDNKNRRLNLFRTGESDMVPNPLTLDFDPPEVGTFITWGWQTKRS